MKPRSSDSILLGHLKDYTNRPSLLESVLSLPDLKTSIDAVAASRRCSILSTAFARGNTILHKAAVEHDVAVFKLVIDSVPVENKFELLKLQNVDGCTPLHLMRNSEFCGNIQYVLTKMSQDTVTELLKLQNQNGETLLHKASLANSTSLNYLLRTVRSVDRFQLLNLRDAYGQTPLFCATASSTRSDDKVKCILEKLSAEECIRLLKAQTSTGQTLLHCASDKPTSDVFKYLLEHHHLTTDCKTSLYRIRDNHGLTVLHKACFSTSTEVVKYMLDHLSFQVRRELLSATDENGATPLHCAATSKGTELFQFLLARMPGNEKAKLLSMKNKKGDTALVCALKNSSTSAAQAMIESVTSEFVCDILDIPNNEGKTAMDIARAHNSQSAVLLLQQFTSMENLESSQDSRPSTFALSVLQDSKPIKKFQTPKESRSNSTVTVTPRVFPNKSPSSSPTELIIDEDQTSPPANAETETSPSTLDLSFSIADMVQQVPLTFEEYMKANPPSADLLELSPVAARKQTMPPRTTTTLTSPRPTMPPHTTTTLTSPRPTMPPHTTTTLTAPRPTVPTHTTTTLTAPRPTVPTHTVTTFNAPKPTVIPQTVTTFNAPKPTVLPHTITTFTAPRPTMPTHTVTAFTPISQTTRLSFGVANIPLTVLSAEPPTVVNTKGTGRSMTNFRNSSFCRSSPDLQSSQSHVVRPVAIAPKRPASVSPSAQPEKDSKFAKMDTCNGWVEGHTLRFKYEGKGHIMSFKPDNTIRELVQQIEDITGHRCTIRDMEGFRFSKQMTLDLVKPPFEFYLGDVRVFISEERKGAMSSTSLSKTKPSTSSNLTEGGQFGRVSNVQEVMALLSFVHKQMREEGKTVNAALKMAKKSRKTIDRFLNIYYLHGENQGRLEELEQEWVASGSPGGLQRLDQLAKGELNWDRLKMLFYKGTVADFRLRKERE